MGLLRQTNKSENDSPLLAMIALNSERIPSDVTLFSSLKDIGIIVEESSIDMQKETAVFFINKHRFFYSLIPMPIPWGDLEGPCTTAWYWPEAVDEMKKQKAHLLIGFFPSPEKSKPDMVRRAILLSKVVAAFVQNTDSIGVYWGSGTIVQQSQVFAERIMNLTDNEIPFELWIDLRINKNQNNTFDFFTTGMKLFGHLEIEIKQSKHQPQDILACTFNIIDYLLTNGPIIKPGHTIGFEEGQKILITNENSIWDKNEKVMGLQF